MSVLFDMQIEHSTFVRAAPEQVYDAFTTAEGLDGWFTQGATVDLRTTHPTPPPWKWTSNPPQVVQLFACTSTATRIHPPGEKR